MTIRSAGSNQLESSRSGGGSQSILLLDFYSILGALLLALSVALLIFGEPEVFYLILVLDLWFLGYHHVVATYTRLVFDSASFKEYRWLVIGLPFVVVAVVAFLYAGYGVVAINTVYFYWQWFHYTRQSYGISKVYGKKDVNLSRIDQQLSSILIYSVSIWCVLYRSCQNPESFLFMPIKMLSTPYWLMAAGAMISILLMGVWGVRQLNSWRLQKSISTHSLYVVSHILIFVVAYIIIDEISYGWLVINVWHNAQYILLVRGFNSRRFKDGVDSRHRFLSTISQDRHLSLYFLACILITFALYKTLEFGAAFLSSTILAWGSLPLLLMAYQVINFHHYVVDGVIWKIRSPSLRKNLDIA